MLEEYALPLLVARNLKEVRGKTRFQKVLYIVQKRARQNNIPLSAFSYEPYLYGPFSSGLARTLDELVSKGLLKQSFEQTNMGYTVVIYGLTQAGTRFLEQISRAKSVDPRVVSTVEQVANEEGRLPLADLVAAAKAL